MRDLAEWRAERYATAIPRAREVALSHGYAIGVHGSQQRDLDLIAVPWIDGAADAETLARAVETAVGGYITTQVFHHALHIEVDQPEQKPHGRLAWSIQLGRGCYIDLSVMPRLPIEGSSE